MKKLSKILVLVLALALLCGVVFAVAASAAEEPKYWYTEDLSESVTGAARQHRDFTGESFDYQKSIDGKNAPAVRPSRAPQEIWAGVVAGKTGHVRSVTDPNGNTYYEYAIRVDRNDGANGNDDTVNGLTPYSTITVNNLSYLTVEFDMMTPTDFPANIRIMTETRNFNGESESALPSGKKPRERTYFGIYDKNAGEWKFANGSLALEAGEWAHITLVYQIHKTEVKGGYNYKDTVANIYVNGEYMGTISGIFSNNVVPATMDAKIYYVSMGWGYGSGMTGTKADDAVGIDNMVFTTYSGAYAEDADNANLADLFGADAVTDITDLGPEIVWTSDYQLPDNSGDVLVIDADETEYGAMDGVTSVKSAIEFIQENEMESATLKLFGNQYNPLVIDFPIELTIDYNGYKLHQGYVVADHLVAEFDPETNTITVSSDPTKLVTVNYYDLPKGQATTPTLVQQIALDREISFRANEIVAQSLVSGKTAYAPLATYKVYDNEGNALSEVPTTVTEDMLGKTYSVYYDYDIKTFDNDIKFSVNVGGKVTYYDSTNDLWAAGVTPEPIKSAVAEADGTQSWTVTQYPKAIPTGATITLYADATISASLYANSGDFYIDLNGYSLTSAKYFFASVAKYTTTPYTQTGDADPVAGTATSSFFIQKNQVFVYSSREGASMTAGSRVVHAQGGIDSSTGVKYYFGYQNESTATKYKFDITFGDKILHLYKGDLSHVYFQNVDLYNTVYSNDGLISAQQCRGLAVYFTDVNLFTLSPLTGSTADSGAKTIDFVRTNVYAEGGIKMNYVNPNPNDKGDYAKGETVYNMTDSKIYGMSFGSTTGDPEMGNNKEAFLTVYLKDKTSRISATHPKQLKLNGVTGAIVAKPETATVNGVTYSTVYGVGTGSEPTAKFEVYDVTFNQYTDDMEPIATLDVVAGYWFAKSEKPTGETIYDFVEDPYNAATPAYYCVFDAQGNALTTGTSVAGETYKAFIQYEKTPVSIAIVDAEGNATPYYTNNLSSLTVPEGSTVVLLSDDTYFFARTAAAWKNVKLDLNGKIVYNTKKINTFTPTANSSIFIYSSAEGAKYYQAKEPASSGYVVTLNAENANVYFGYKDADTMSPYRIAVHCGAFCENKSAGSNLYLAQLDIYKISGDNYGFLNFRGGAAANRNFFFEDCNIYLHNGPIVHLRGTGTVGQVTLKNTNIYANSSGGFVGYDQNPTTTELVINLENVAIYGKMPSIGTVPSGTTLTVNVKGTFTAPFMSDKFVLEAGKTLLPFGTIVTLGGHTAPDAGVYGADNKVYAKGNYASAYTLGATEQFKAYAFQNMTLDTNVVANLYVPAGSITSAKIGSKEILDTNKTETIGGTVYYVLSFDAAPKFGDKSATITVTLFDGTTVDFEMSVARYAKMLLGLEAEEGTYVADAQNLMKYILTYIKEVAVKYGGADEETIFAELGDFTVDTDVEMTETVYDLSAINTYVTHAALDLDAYAGFAFKVAEGFVGTIKLELAGVEAVEYTFTAEAPASATEVVVLENVPAHIFRGDVVITVTPAEGETVAASFNLATYAATFDEAYVKALYAYSLAAKEYNAKYPTVGTAN